MSSPDLTPGTRRSNLRDNLGVGIVLVVIWTFLWGVVSPANVASGALVAALLLVAFPLDRDVAAARHRLRPVAAARLAAFFLADLFRSTLATAADVVRPRSRVRTGIVACPLRVDDDGVLTFLANLIAISPGTMPIEVTSRPNVIYVHSLRGGDPDEVRSFVARLEELLVMALGGPDTIGALAEPAPWPPPPPEPHPTREEGTP